MLHLAAPEAEDRQHAVKALGEIGPAAPEVVPALITALGDADTTVRRAAAYALGRIGPAAAEAVPALTTALQDPNRNVVDAVKTALEQIRSASPATNSV